MTNIENNLKKYEVSSSSETIFDFLKELKNESNQNLESFVIPSDAQLVILEEIFEGLTKEFGPSVDQQLQLLLKEFLQNKTPSRITYSALYRSFKYKLLEKNDALPIVVLDTAFVKKEEVDIGKEEINAEKEEVDIGKEEINAEKEKIKEAQIILDNFDITEAAYQNLSTDLKAEVEAKIQDSHYSSYKKILEKELKSQGIEDPNYVDQYLRYYILEQEFAEKLAQEPHAQEFKSSYEKLQKSIGLSVATLHRSDSESVSRFIVDHFDIQKGEMPEFLSSQGLLDDKFDEYLTKEEKNDLKGLIGTCPSTHLIALLKLEQSYAIDLNDLKFDLKTLSEREKEWLKSYINNFNGIKKRMFERLEKSKNALRYQLMAAPILGMSSYLDTSIDEQNLAENFLTLRQKTDIQKKGENLSIRGEIFGQQVTLVQNGEQQLMIKDALSRDPDKGFEQDSKYLDLKVRLPSAFLLEEQSKKRFEKNLNNMMQSESDGKNPIVHELGAELLNMYQPYQLFVKNRLSNQLQRTVSKQDFWDTLQTLGGNLPLSEYNIQLEKDHPNSKIFQNRIKMTDQLPAESAHLLSDQLKRFRSLMQGSDTEKLKFANQSDQIFEKLDDQQRDPQVDKIVNLKDTENPLFQFLGLFVGSAEQEKTLLVQDMKKYLDLIESGDDVGSMLKQGSGFSDKFIANYGKLLEDAEKEEGEENFELALKDLESEKYSYA